MAECLSEELKRLMLEPPFHFFLYATRAAFNRMIGRDQNDTRIWTTIINPRDELLTVWQPPFMMLMFWQLTWRMHILMLHVLKRFGSKAKAVQNVVKTRARFAS